MKKRNLVLFGTVATLSLALAGSIGTVVASAEKSITNAAPDEQTTTVTYSVEDAWTVTIPDTIDIASPDGDNDKVSASGVKIEPDKKLTVKVSSGNAWHLRASGQEAQEGGIEYELKADSGSALTDGGTVLEVEAGTASKEASLTANVKAGNENYSTGGEAYTDTLTFTVEVA